MCIYFILERLHFYFLLYERNIKTTDISFSTNILATRDSSFTMYTNNWYLTKNLEIQYIISHHLSCKCVVVTRVFQTDLFCLISPKYLYILSVTDGRYLQLNTQFLQKSVLVSVLGIFLVNLMCLYLLWKFSINQQWMNEVVQSREK